MNTNPENKFKDMEDETAISKLNSLVGVLERNEGAFDELIEVYKEAFEYYTYCSEYLSSSAEKIKELNNRLNLIRTPREDV